ncbi:MULTISPECIES: FxsA family protein [Thalassotalea]|uniref:FxsA family protein n=1 Tax=Thalassotalea TaxID=1518149 RepID=UPI00094338FC|nr:MULTISPECIES: FxsA family protein [Thalassotalea]OKY27300.1 hypothetical protein BI291_00265 [Thalassotalea sp. PP2-459]
MFRILFFLFIVIPIIEIMVLMQVGALIGAWPTIAIVVITAWLGAKNVKQQGIATLQSVQDKMAQGEAPSNEIVAGLLLLVAGVLLVTPGFVTDFFGLSLLIPQVRNGLINAVQKQLSQHTVVHTQQFGFHQQSPFDQEEQQPEQRNENKTIEGEFERKE